MPIDNSVVGYVGQLIGVSWGTLGFFLSVLGIVAGSLSDTSVGQWLRLSPKRYLLLAIAALFVGQYLTYRRVTGELIADLPKAPKVHITHFDPVLAADQHWEADISDDANPGTSVSVELNHGDLHVTMRNPRGFDRSALPREVRIKAAGK